MGQPDVTRYIQDVDGAKVLHAVVVVKLAHSIHGHPEAMGFTCDAHLDTEATSFALYLEIPQDSMQARVSLPPSCLPGTLIEQTPHLPSTPLKDSFFTQRAPGSPAPVLLHILFPPPRMPFLLCSQLCSPCPHG